MSFSNIGNNNLYIGYIIKKQNVSAHVNSLRRYTKPIPYPKQTKVSLSQKNITPLSYSPPNSPSPAPSSTDTDESSSSNTPSSRGSLTSSNSSLSLSEPDISDIETDDEFDWIAKQALEKTREAMTRIFQQKIPPPTQSRILKEDDQDFSAIYATSETASILSEAPYLPAQNEKRYPYLDGFVQIAAVIKHAGEFGMAHLIADPTLEDLGDIPSEDIDYQLFRLGNPVETLIATYDQETSKSLTKTRLFEEQSHELERRIQEKEKVLGKIQQALKAVNKHISSYKEVPSNTPNIKEQLLRESALPKPLQAPQLLNLIPPFPVKPLRDIEMTEQEKRKVAKTFLKNFSPTDQTTIETMVKNLGNGSISIKREAGKDFLNTADDMGASSIVERLAQSLSQKRAESSQAFSNQMTAKSNRDALDNYNAALDSALTELVKKTDGALQLLRIADKEVTFPAKQKEVRAMIAGLHSLQSF